MATAEYMTTEEAAGYLKISAVNLRLRRKNGKSPKFINIGRSVRYRRADLDAWAMSLVRDPKRLAEAA